MGKLRDKLAKARAKPKISQTPKVFVPEDHQVDFMGKGVSARVLGRYFRMLDRKRKSVEAELEVVKNELRKVGEQAIRGSENYVAMAVIGPVEVKRANKFQQMAADIRPDLVDAVGETEYNTLFAEEATLRFSSIGELEGFLSVCSLGGIHCPAEPKTGIKPRSSFALRLNDIRHGLDQEVLETLEDAAVDQRASVGRCRR